MLKYIFFLFSLSFFAQNTTIKGVVKNNNAPLSSVFVYIADANNLIKHYTKTNENGYFEIQTLTKENYFLQVKGLNFKNVSIPLDKILPFYEINVEPKENVIEPVQIKNNNSPIKKTGDTIRYKLKAFTNNNDRVLSDALKNIPGIEAQDNGQIKYQGLPISNFYIDGDDIVGKRYNIATDNITNEIVDEIQILENDQPIKMLQGKVTPKNAALNITFKEKFKGKIIHDLAVGIGVPNLLNFKYNNLVIKQKYKSINYLKFNNTGKNLLKEFNQLDSSDLKKMVELDFPTEIVDVNSVGTPPLKQDRYNNNENGAGTLNFSFRLNKEIDIKTNTFFARDFVTNNYQSNFQINLPIFNINFNEQNNFNEKYNLFYQQFLIRKNTKSIYFNNDINVKGYFTNKNSDVFNNQSIYQNIKNKNFELNNNLSVITKLKNVIVNFKSNLTYAILDQNLNISPGISKSVFNNNKAYLNTNQTVDNQLFFLKNSLSFLYNRKLSSYNLLLGTVSSLRDNTTQIFADANNVTNFLNNNTTSYFKNFATFTHDYKTERFIVNTKITPTYWIINGLQKHALFSNDLSLFVEKKFKIEHAISFNYNFNNEPNHVANFYQNGYLVNYRNFVYKNLDYLIDSKNSFGFNLKLQKTIKLLFFYASVSKSYINSSYIYNTSFTQNLNTTTFENLNNKTEAFNANSSITKYFFSLKSTLKAKIEFNQGNRNSKINNNLVENVSTNQVYTFSFKPTIADWIKFSTEYSYGINTTKNSNLANENKIFSHKSENSLDVFFKKYFSLKITSELVAFKNQSENTNHFLDAFLNYRKQGEKLEFTLAYTNIFNKVSYYTQQNDLNSFQTTNFFLRPSNLLLTCFFKF